jgi:hypothetical protein
MPQDSAHNQETAKFRKHEVPTEKQQGLGRTNHLLPFIRPGSQIKRQVQFFYWCISIRCRETCLPSRCPATIGRIHIQTHRESRVTKRELSEVVFSLQSDQNVYKGDNVEHGSWRIYDDGICRQATTGEDAQYWHDLVRDVVNCRMCELGIAL